MTPCASRSEQSPQAARRRRICIERWALRAARQRSAGRPSRAQGVPLPAVRGLRHGDFSPSWSRNDVCTRPGAGYCTRLLANNQMVEFFLGERRSKLGLAPDYRSCHGRSPSCATRRGRASVARCGTRAWNAITPNVCRSPFGLAAGPSIPAAAMTAFTGRHAVVRAQAKPGGPQAQARVGPGANSKPGPFRRPARRTTPRARRINVSKLTTLLSISIAAGVRRRISDSRPPLHISIRERRRRSDARPSRRGPQERIVADGDLVVVCTVAAGSQFGAALVQL
jgi:hypothetical protein